jgi:hypothetical protein
VLRHALHAKFHHATVTYCDADYVGSITIDRDLLDASGMREREGARRRLRQRGALRDLRDPGRARQRRHRRERRAGAAHARGAFPRSDRC